MKPRIIHPHQISPLYSPLVVDRRGRPDNDSGSRVANRAERRARGWRGGLPDGLRQMRDAERCVSPYKVASGGGGTLAPREGSQRVSQRGRRRQQTARVDPHTYGPVTPHVHPRHHRTA